MVGNVQSYLETAAKELSKNDKNKTFFACAGSLCNWEIRTYGIDGKENVIFSTSDHGEALSFLAGVLVAKSLYL